MCYYVLAAVYEISFICRTAYLSLMVNWQTTEFWPCLLLLTVMPVTTFGIIFELFLLRSYSFHLFSFFKMFASSFLNKAIKTRNLVLLATSEQN